MKAIWRLCWCVIKLSFAVNLYALWGASMVVCVALSTIQVAVFAVGGVWLSAFLAVGFGALAFWGYRFMDFVDGYFWSAWREFLDALKDSPRE